MDSCTVCGGRGTVRNPGDNWTTTVEAAAAYEQRHGGAPAYISCRECSGTGKICDRLHCGDTIGPCETCPRAIALEALAGPQETMQAAGFTNRGSLAYAMTHRGFPQPVKVLRGIRLWDLDAVKTWTTQQEER